MALTAGTRLGPYEIVAPLGAGGMGEVYRARDTRLDRTVAIKILPDTLAGDPQFRERFDREARSISQLDHPHICALHDVGEEQGTAYLVMQYLEGDTLAARLERGALPLDEALTIAIQIAGALDAAHRAGIVHRDLKPGNVMLVRRSGGLEVGEAKLLDFGLAKVTPAAVAASGLSVAPTGLTPVTVQGTILGTLQYMAPEQIEGRDADARTDIFAFGGVLYQMLTGRHAFEGGTQASLMAAILERQPQPVPELLPDVPPALDRILRKCLAKNPDDRWQTARDLTTELAWVEQELQRDSRPQPAMQEAGSLRGRAVGPARALGRWREALAWTLAAAALGAAVLLATSSPASDASASGAVRFALFPPERGIFEYGALAPLPAVAPDGKRIAFLASQGGPRAIWVRTLESLEPVPLRGTEDADLPFWSPDSRHIAFVARGQLKRIDLGGGPPQTLASVSGFEGGSWSPEGIILYGTAGGGVWRVSAAGGMPAPVTKPDTSRGEAGHTAPHFLPDGRRFLFLSVPSKTIRLGSLDEPETTALLTADSRAMYAPPGYLLFVRAGTLMAHSFDASRGEVSGEAVPIAESIAITNTGRAVFDVSPGGVLVYRTAIEGTGLGRFLWLDRSGRIVQDAGNTSSGVTLSPDARRSIVHVHDVTTGGGGLWLLDSVRALRTRFTLDASHNASPVWSPDGTRVVFASTRNGGPDDLYQKLSSGAGADELLLESDEPKRPIGWSRDGQFITYESVGAKTGVDLWVLPLADRRPAPFLRTEFNEVHGQLSPDGRWMAYASDESGQLEVYVQPFPATGGKWQISTQGGMMPRWREGGRELFYLALDRRLMAVEIDASGESLNPSAPAALFDTNALVVPTGSQPYYSYAVSGDGQRFAVAQNVEGPDAPPLTVVLDWLETLRR